MHSEDYTQQLGAYYFSCLYLILWFCFCILYGIDYLYNKIKKRLAK